MMIQIDELLMERLHGLVLNMTSHKESLKPLASASYSQLPLRQKLQSDLKNDSA
jgi:hypothetical protein